MASLEAEDHAHGDGANFYDVPSLGGSEDELGIGCLIVAVVLTAVLLVPLVLSLFELVVLLVVFLLLVIIGGSLGLRRWTIEVEGVEPVGDVRRALDPASSTGNPHG